MAYTFPMVRCLVLALCLSISTLPFAAAQAADSDGILDGRAELNWRPGSDRSILMNEFWVPFYQADDGIGADRVLYGDVRLMGDDHDNHEFNIGAGYRQLVEWGSLRGIAGSTAWFDRRTTDMGNTFHQITLGGEFLSDWWDIRTNAYLPLSDSKTRTLSFSEASDPFLAGTGIFYAGGGLNQIVEEPQAGLDLELGVRLPFMDSLTDSTRVYGAVYHFEGDESENISGWRTRVAADITPDFQLGARFQRDDERGSQGFLEATVRFPFGNKKSFRKHNIRSRLDESPERDIDIVTGSRETGSPGGGVTAVTNAQSGQAQRVIYVDNTAAGGGDGSLERPYNTLAAAQGALRDYDVVYIKHGDGTASGMDDGLAVGRSNVYIIGEGATFVFDNNRFSAQGGGSLSGYVLRAAGSAPVISNTNLNGDGISITGGNVSVTGLSVDNAARHGISAYSGTGASLGQIAISNVTVSNSGEDGIRFHADGAGSSVGGSVSESSVTNNKNGARFYASDNASVSGAMQETFVSANTQHGVIVYDDSTAGAVNVDLGGGGTSGGQNSFFGNTIEDLAVDVDGAALHAANNWWGQASGAYRSAPGGGLTPQIYFGAPIEDGLIGHWTLDSEWVSGTTAYDRSGFGRNGSMSGGLTDADLVAAHYGEGLDFDGTTVILLPGSDEFVPTTDAPITLVAGFNADTIDPTALDDRLINIKRGGANSNVFLNVGDNNKAAYFRVGGGATTMDDTAITTGSANQSAVTYDGTTFRPYLNGAADSGVGVNGLIAGSGDPAAIGAFGTNDSGFDGVIDDVRIYDRALTAGEIGELHRMNTGSTVDTSGHLTVAP